MRNLLKRRPAGETKPTLRERFAAMKAKAASLGPDANKGRRAVLAGTLAAAVPLPALAASKQPSAAEAAFLALAPEVLPLLRQVGPATDKAHSLFAAGDAAAGEYPGRTHDDSSAAEAWSATARATRNANGYYAAWEAANDLDKAVSALADPFINEPMRTLPGIMLKAALNDVGEWWGDSAMADLSRLAAERFGLPAREPFLLASGDDDDDASEAKTA